MNDMLGFFSSCGDLKPNNANATNGHMGQMGQQQQSCQMAPQTPQTPSSIPDIILTGKKGA